MKISFHFFESGINVAYSGWVGILMVLKIKDLPEGRWEGENKKIKCLKKRSNKAWGYIVNYILFSGCSAFKVAVSTYF